VVKNKEMGIKKIVQLGENAAELTEKLKGSCRKPYYNDKSFYHEISLVKSNEK